MVSSPHLQNGKEESVMRISSFIWFLVSFTLIACASAVLSTGCANLGYTDSPEKVESISIDQGGTDPILQMPVQAGKSLLCTQGAFGTVSHNTTSTKYDVDLDTSNTLKEELFAPISGTARVHLEDASKNFGLHICIDLGNGYYVILGHMSDILVQDGQEVGVGQLLGHEGCTGYCSGDHVHIGLHKGDASKMGQFGESVPVSYLLADKTIGGSPASIASTSVICGIKSLGDPVDGHFYTSSLPIAKWHPDGSLVKTPVSSIVYRIDSGQLRNLVTQDVFWSYGYDFKHVLPMSEQEYACYPHGADVNANGLVEAFYDPAHTLWLVVGTVVNPNRYRVQVRATAWEKVLQSWGLDYSSAKLPSSSSQYESWSVKDGFAPFRDGTLVRDTSHSDVYVISDAVAVPVGDWNTFLLLGYRPTQVMTVEDGAIGTVMNTVGNCANGLWCLNQSAIDRCGGGLSLENAGGSQISISSIDGPDSVAFNDPDSGDTSSVSDVVSMNSIPDAVEEQDAGSFVDTLQNAIEDALASSSLDADVTTLPDIIVQISSDSFSSSSDTFSTGDVSLAKDTDDTSPVSVNPVSSKDFVWLTDQDFDGMQETLLIDEFEWVNQGLSGVDAFVYGTGGCFDGILTEDDRVKASNGYYEVSFGKFKAPCVGELSLISSIGTNGQLPNSLMTNWYWWQNAPFCATSSTLCQLQKNGTPWEEWLLRVSWNPVTGLTASGNAFTKNAQLK